MSDILFISPACEKRMTVDEEAAGRQCACVDCEQKISVPAQALGCTIACPVCQGSISLPPPIRGIRARSNPEEKEPM
jgi:hypothetical protein